MNGVLESLGGICVVLAASELAGRLCPQNAMVGFVRALAVLVLLFSAVFSLTGVDWDLSQPAQRLRETGEELSVYIEEQEGEALEMETEEYLSGLLKAANIPPEKIEAVTDIGEDGCIVLTKVSVVFAYESDRQRALGLLQNVLGDTELEVKTSGR